MNATDDNQALQTGSFYQAYLLRIWRQRVEGQAVWRISLENVHTGERVIWHNLDDLMIFLKTHMN